MARTQFGLELEAVRQNLIRMGETTVALFGEAMRVVAESNARSLEKASELESQTDHQHRLIHDQCLSLITRQAPVARDARLVTGALDAIVDLELIGDYAYEIATLSASLPRRPPSQVLVQILDTGGKAQEFLVAAVGCWRTGAVDPAVCTRPNETAIKTECESLYQKLSQLTSAPGDATTYVDLMLICRHVERILRHALSVAEQAAQAGPFESGQ